MNMIRQLYQGRAAMILRTGQVYSFYLLLL